MRPSFIWRKHFDLYPLSMPKKSLTHPRWEYKVDNATRCLSVMNLMITIITIVCTVGYLIVLPDEIPMTMRYHRDLVMVSKFLILFWPAFSVGATVVNLMVVSQKRRAFRNYSQFALTIDENPSYPTPRGVRFANQSLAVLCLWFNLFSINGLIWNTHMESRQYFGLVSFLLIIALVFWGILSPRYYKSKSKS